jgi:hypothetical protein
LTYGYVFTGISLCWLIISTDKTERKKSELTCGIKCLRALVYTILPIGSLLCGYIWFYGFHWAVYFSWLGQNNTMYQIPVISIGMFIIAYSFLVLPSRIFKCCLIEIKEDFFDYADGFISNDAKFPFKSSTIRKGLYDSVVMSETSVIFCSKGN